uniref:DUF397 domain-containing protein n=1 Tax=Steinernema glaseri TaxID=37863 RepID=A0A1I8A744_9BILA
MTGRRSDYTKGSSTCIVYVCLRRLQIAKEGRAPSARFQAPLPTTAPYGTAGVSLTRTLSKRRLERFEKGINT